MLVLADLSNYSALDPLSQLTSGWLNEITFGPFN